MAAYTTNEKVRREAGFSGNTNIDEERITDAVNAAHDVVLGVVSRTYTLPLSYVPAILELIERRLAASYLMTEEYGEQAEGTGKEAKRKDDWATEQLKAITKGTTQLLDEDGIPLASNPKAGMEGLPLTNDPEGDEGERAFTRDMEF